MIRFTCPNGHPLAAPPARVGKTGQCPRCQARFVVPAEAVDGDVSSESLAGDERADTAAAAAAAPSNRGDRFAFLCPNGHKLHGSPALQGRPGQCPHCQSRFMIPRLEPSSEILAEPQMGPQWSLRDVTDDPPEEGDDLAEYAEYPEYADAVVDHDVRLADRPPPPPLAVSCHPLAQLLRRLWMESAGTGSWQLQLRGGNQITVESFSPELSQDEYGVFALPRTSAGHSICVIAWEQVEQITVRNLTELPDGGFLAATATRLPIDLPR